MSFFFSKDNRYFKTSPNATPMLTPSGVDDYYAAVKIQRWWRKSKETIVFDNLYTKQSSSSSSSSCSSSPSSTSASSDNSLYVNASGLRKRKLDEIETDMIEDSCDASCEASCEESVEEIDTDFDIETTDEEDETEFEDETRLVNHNNFLWDFITSFFSFFMRLFGLN